MRNTTVPFKRLNSQRSAVATVYFLLISFTLGILFVFFIGYFLVYFGSFIPICASDCNFTKMVKYKHLEVELTTGITQFVQLVDEVDETLSPYVEDIIHQLSNNIQKSITDLKDLQESTKPKIRRRPPLEEWNSNATIYEK
jgi:type III secretory pathway component EscU